MAIHPRRLNLMPGLGVIVGAVNEPAAVGMKLTATEEIGRGWLGEGKQIAGTSQVNAEQLATLVTIVVLGHEYGGAVF
jgi:hypothetical protein